MKSNGKLSTLRNFGYSRIEWTVQNYFSATCMEDWIIGSPTFSVNGMKSIKWRLFLNKETNCFENKTTICASLVNVEKDSLQEPIWVSWKLFFPCDVGKSELEVESDFENKNSVDIEIGDACELESIMQYSAEDTLIIRSLIIVSAKDSEAYKRSENFGLKSLSQDLTVLFRTDRNFDLKLLVGELSGKAHKGILYCRNNVMKTAIERGHSVTTLPDLDIEAVKEVFGYLYTGNLDYVLRKPSFSLLQVIKYFGIKEIEEYYEPDEIELCSEFKMKKHIFECAVPLEKIADSNITILSSTLQKNVSATEQICALQFPPRSASKSGMSGYISIFIDDMEKNFSKISYVEVAVMNPYGNVEHLQRKRCPESSSKLTFENFLPRDALSDLTFTCDGKLHLLCTIFIPIMGSRLLSTTFKKVHTDIIVDTEKHYKMLSNQMIILFENGLYSDVTLSCDGESFPVHTYFLSARSHVFRNLFESIKAIGSTADIEISSMKSNILRAVLYYMYSGKLPKFEITDILNIYEAAERFYVLPLKYTCSRILQENLELLDVKSVLNMAEKFKDYKLLTCVRKFISRKTSD